MKIQKEIIFNPREEIGKWSSWIRSEADPQHTVFLDIETTGFSRRYDCIYLVGIMYLEEGQLVMEQYLASSPSDEPELLRAVCRKLESFQSIVTFNGDTFDLPFMRERIKLMRLREELPQLDSIDLYRKYRTIGPWLQWESCRLTEIEKQLGIIREDQKSGGDLIDVFYEYSIARDPVLEKELLLHNYEDILELPSLLCVQGMLSVLKKMDYSGFFVLEEPEKEQVLLQILLTEELPVTAEMVYDLNGKKTTSSPIRCQIRKNESMIEFAIPAVQMKMKFFLPDYQDYYVLPDGMLIHKSLGTPPDRKKAAPRDCFLEKTDIFLPCPEPKKALNGVHLFRPEYEDKQRFYSLGEIRKKLGNCSDAEQHRFLISFLPKQLRIET